MLNGGVFRRDKVRRAQIRRGVNPEDRSSIWWTLSGAESVKIGGLYHDLVFQEQNTTPTAQWDPHFEAIEKDLHRTFPQDTRFHRGAPLEVKLRRILRCYAIANPSIGYCQSLNFICGLILQVDDDEERVFWLLSAICAKWLPHVHDTNLEGVSIYQGVLLLYLKQRSPQLYAAIVTLEGAPSLHEMLLHPPALFLPTTAWFMTLYISALPLPAVFTLWDNILYEGPAAIFSVALEIFALVGGRIIALAHCGRNGGEIFQVVQNSPKLLGDIRVFVGGAFQFVGSDRDLRAKVARVVRGRAEIRSLIERRAQWGVDEEARRELLTEGEKPPPIGINYQRWRAKLKLKRRL